MVTEEVRADTIRLYIESKFIGEIKQVTDIYWNDPNSFRFVMAIGADIAALTEYQDRRSRKPLAFRVDYPQGDQQTFDARIVELIFRSDFGCEIEIRTHSTVAHRLPA